MSPDFLNLLQGPDCWQLTGCYYALNYAVIKHKSMVRESAAG